MHVREVTEKVQREKEDRKPMHAEMFLLVFLLPECRIKGYIHVSRTSSSGTFFANCSPDQTVYNYNNNKNKNLLIQHFLIITCFMVNFGLKMFRTTMRQIKLDN